MVLQEVTTFGDEERLLFDEINQDRFAGALEYQILENGGALISIPDDIGEKDLDDATVLIQEAFVFKR